MKKAIFFSIVLFLFGCSAPVIYKTAPAELDRPPLDFNVGVAVLDASAAQSMMSSILCFDSRKKLDALQASRYLVNEIKASGLFKKVDLAVTPAQVSSADILVRGRINTLGFPARYERTQEKIVIDMELQASVPSQQLVLWRGKIVHESEVGRAHTIFDNSLSCSSVLQNGFREFRSRLIEAADAYQSGRPLGEEATAPTPSTRQTLENIQKELQE